MFVLKKIIGSLIKRGTLFVKCSSVQAIIPILAAELLLMALKPATKAKMKQYSPEKAQLIRAINER